MFYCSGTAILDKGYITVFLSVRDSCSDNRTATTFLGDSNETIKSHQNTNLDIFTPYQENVFYFNKSFVCCTERGQGKKWSLSLLK